MWQTGEVRKEGVMMESRSKAAVSPRSTPHPHHRHPIGGGGFITPREHGPACCWFFWSSVLSVEWNMRQALASLAGETGSAKSSKVVVSDINAVASSPANFFGKGG